MRSRLFGFAKQLRKLTCSLCLSTILAGCGGTTVSEDIDNSGETPISTPTPTPTPSLTMTIEGETVFITGEGLYYAEYSDDQRVSFLKKADLNASSLSDFSNWVSIKPIKGGITGVVHFAGWLLVSDGYNIYKASKITKSGKWDIARRVWNVVKHGARDHTISSMSVGSSGSLNVSLANGNDESTINIVNSDLGFSSCSGNEPTDYSYIVERPYETTVPGESAGIEFIPGELPIILSSPHGGGLTDTVIDIFNDGLTTDGGSQQATLLLYEYLIEHTGKAPHLIVNHIRRNRLNLNRYQDDDNQQSEAQDLWQAYHNYTNDAKDWISSVCGKGLFIDMHTNGRVWLPVKRISHSGHGRRQF